MIIKKIWEQRLFPYSFDNENVYLIHANRDKIAEFNGAMSDWQGGQIFEANAKNGYEFYWAYSFRTSQQAREFMFKAIGMGIELQIGEFDQTHFLPDLRETLDSIEKECEDDEARLFALPDRSVLLDVEDMASVEEVRCLINGLDENGLMQRLRVDIEIAPKMAS